MSVQNHTLKLNRPLVFLDLEATGVDVVKDRIVEIALLKYFPDGSIQRKPEKPEERWLIHPECSIPLESSLIHGIYDEDVKDKPTFAQISKNLYKFLFDCDLVGFNSNKFDIPLLVEEFMRAGLTFDMRDHRLIDVQTIFHLMEERTLKAGYQFYCQKELTNAHQAMSDVQATFEIFWAQLEKYKEVSISNKKGENIKPIQEDMDILHQTCQRQNAADFVGRLIFGEEDREIYFNFGKYKGQKVKEVFKRDPFYYDWILKGDFSHFTKQVIKDIKKEMNENIQKKSKNF